MRTMLNMKNCQLELDSRFLKQREDPRVRHSNIILMDQASKARLS